MAPATAAAAPTASDAERTQATFARLLQSLHAEPWAHDFFALMRRVDALHPQHPRTGAAPRPTLEPLRLAQQPEMDFAPAPLHRLQWREDGLPPRLTVRFFGLLGPQGPMPLHLTEYVRERLRQHGDAASAHFLDLFHHRLLSLFYRAWAQAQPAVHADRPRDDRYLVWLGALAGLPPVRGSGGSPAGEATAAADPGGLPPHALAFEAGLLAGRSRHPEALVKVLRLQLGVPAQVLPHVPHWLAIDAEDRTRLGRARNRSAGTGSGPAAAALLGHSANLGSRVWDRQYRFRLRLGPLSLAQYFALLPGGALWQPLRRWLMRLARPELHWELELVLAPPQRPDPRLASAARPAPRRAPGMRLGVTSWLPAGRGRPSLSPSPRPAPDPARRDATPQPLRLRPDTAFLRRRPLQLLPDEGA